MGVLNDIVDLVRRRVAGVLAQEVVGCADIDVTLVDITDPVLEIIHDGGSPVMLAALSRSPLQRLLVGVTAQVEVREVHVTQGVLVHVACPDRLGVGIVVRIDPVLFAPVEELAGGDTAALDVEERQAAARGGLLGQLRLTRLAGLVCRLHGEVRGEAVAAQTADEGVLAPERPLTPLAAAMPLVDGVRSGQAGTLIDDHVVGGVIAIHRCHDPVGGHVLNVDGTTGLQAHSLGPHIRPCRFADDRVGVHQVHVLTHAGVQAGGGLHQVGRALDGDDRVPAELLDRVVPRCGVGRQDVDVFVAQTSGTIRGGNQFALKLGVVNVGEAVEQFAVTLDRLVLPLFVPGLLAGVSELLVGMSGQPVLGIPDFGPMGKLNFRLWCLAVLAGVGLMDGGVMADADLHGEVGG